MTACNTARSSGSVERTRMFMSAMVKIFSLGKQRVPLHAQNGKFYSISRVHNQPYIYIYTHQHYTDEAHN
jgi:hypothetical protein